jgi:hypothetical protein
VGWTGAFVLDACISALLPCVKGTSAAADMHESPTMPINQLIDGHRMSAIEANADSLRSDTLVLIGGAVSNAGGPGDKGAVFTACVFVFDYGHTQSLSC